MSQVAAKEKENNCGRNFIFKIDRYFEKRAGFITGGNDWKAIRRFSNKLTTVDKHHVFGAVSFHEINFKVRQTIWKHFSMTRED